MAVAHPQILAFDVFGTVVDWHDSIAREMAARYPQVDGDAFALAWRKGYQPAMDLVRQGQLGWTRMDVLHRRILDGILPQFGLGGMPEAERAELNRVWHRLSPWPDAVAGLQRLKSRFVITPLSNGNIALLTHMAKNAGLPWDCVLSAEVFQAYKPDPRAYLGVADVFGVEASAVMLVAAHHSDLAAARGCGLQTAYIQRPHEYGSNQPKDVTPQPNNTYHCSSILDLADQLGC
ncbi:haloacid dehalogenase type II [Comamonas sp. MYb69]|uniref:haloacid dehalogenase type II n=1 Tax=Comamonas sp. MYb69 TaxID=1848650 RepID=UPI0030ABF512